MNRQHEPTMYGTSASPFRPHSADPVLYSGRLDMQRWIPTPAAPQTGDSADAHGGDDLHTYAREPLPDLPFPNSNTNSPPLYLDDEDRMQMEVPRNQLQMDALTTPTHHRSESPQTQPDPEVKLLPNLIDEVRSLYRRGGKATHAAYLKALATIYLPIWPFFDAQYHAAQIAKLTAGMEDCPAEVAASINSSVNILTAQPPHPAADIHLEASHHSTVPDPETYELQTSTTAILISMLFGIRQEYPVDVAHKIQKDVQTLLDAEIPLDDKIRLIGMATVAWPYYDFTPSSDIVKLAMDEQRQSVGRLGWSAADVTQHMARATAQPAAYQAAMPEQTVHDGSVATQTLTVNRYGRKRKIVAVVRNLDQEADSEPEQTDSRKACKKARFGQHVGDARSARAEASLIQQIPAEEEYDSEEIVVAQRQPRSATQPTNICPVPKCQKKFRPSYRPTHVLDHLRVDHDIKLPKGHGGNMGKLRESQVDIWTEWLEANDHPIDIPLPSSSTAAKKSATKGVSGGNQSEDEGNPAPLHSSPVNEHTGMKSAAKQPVARKRALMVDITDEAEPDSTVKRKRAAMVDVMDEAELDREVETEGEHEMHDAVAGASESPRKKGLRRNTKKLKRSANTLTSNFDDLSVEDEPDDETAAPLPQSVCKSKPTAKKHNAKTPVRTESTLDTDALDHSSNDGSEDEADKKKMGSGIAAYGVHNILSYSRVRMQTKRE